MFEQQQRKSWPRRHKFLTGLGVLAGIIVIAIAAGSAGSQNAGTPSSNSVASTTDSSPSSSGQYTLKSCYVVMPLVQQVNSDVLSGSPDWAHDESLINDASTAARKDGAFNAITLQADLASLVGSLANAGLDSLDTGHPASADTDAVNTDLNSVTADCHR